MSWEAFVENGRADADAAQATTLTFHDGDPGSTGANQILAVAISWSPGGQEGPVPALQPPSVGVAFAAPLVELPVGQTTHYGFRDSGGAWLGGFLLAPPVETVTLGPRQFLAKIGPNV